MKVGYARVSTDDQNLDLQQDALKAAGCERIFTDKVSGKKTERVGLSEALTFIRQGDVLVVWKLDRLGRSLTHLIETINALNERGIQFTSLTEQIDTSTSGGRLILHIFAALAEFERNLIRECTMAGLTAARARGILGGRKRLLTPAQVRQARTMYSDKTVSIASICETLGISRTTLYRYINQKEA